MNSVPYAITKIPRYQVTVETASDQSIWIMKYTDFFTRSPSILFDYYINLRISVDRLIRISYNLANLN